MPEYANMEGIGNISDYRKKLDKTLASPDLTNDEMIYTLVKNQITHSSNYQFEEYSEYVVERRSKQLSNFLSMLRSASENDVETSKSSDASRKGWKVKQDTDEFRVMYREGLEGTPFHTLLAEGYVDGPVDVCLCISCESDLYKHWWPRISFPAFGVMSSKCIQTVSISEQISVVRMKVAWPMSSREALVHYFTFEYFQDGLIVVLLNTISDSEDIDRNTHGFTRDGIPTAQDVVRMDIVGGFALQKVTEDRSYFRTIANLDIKLDFVPPSLINFISRQLIGSGFKLYKKEVAYVSKGDEKFLEALKNPLYTHIHEALYSEITSMLSSDQENSINTSPKLEEQSVDASKDNIKVSDEGVNDGIVPNQVIEFEEKDTERSESLDKGRMDSSDDLTNGIMEEDVNSTEMEEAIVKTNDISEEFRPEIKNKVGISQEVLKALGTLEKAMSILREYNSNAGKGQSDIAKGHLINLGEEKPISSEPDQLRRQNEVFVESSKMESTEMASHELRSSSNSSGSRHKGSNSHARETNQNKIVPASPNEGCSSPSHDNYIDLHPSLNQGIPSDNIKESYSPSTDPNSFNGKRATKIKNRKWGFCCLNIIS